MITLYYIILILSLVFFASLLSLGAYTLFSKMAMVDAPNERSNHDRLVVTGVGVGFMTTILAFLVVVNAPSALIAGGVLLLVISVFDDRNALSARLRFGVQVGAVLLAVTLFEGKVFQGLLPEWLDMIITAVMWLWVINLTNFMDGIDEITVTQLASVTGAIVLLGLIFAAVPHTAEIDALVIFIPVLCFYPWNKHPAKCFMGDAGSVPLGYLLGYLMFSLAAAGQWQMALILPAYYLCDATITLARRVLRGQPFWKAHSEHFYQQAARAGHQHHFIARHVLLLNLFLAIFAGLALYKPEHATLMLVPAYVLALGLCFYFAMMRTPAEQGILPHEAAV